MTHHVRLSEVLRLTIQNIARLEGTEAIVTTDMLDDLSIELQSQLHTAGYAIHANDGRCVRVPPAATELGREMTPAEAAALPVGEHIPKARPIR